MVKRSWVTHFGDDAHRLCIRCKPNGNSYGIIFDESKFPPLEPVNGKRLNIDEAKELGLVEKHYTIGLFSTDDLIMIRDAINISLGVSTDQEDERLVRFKQKFMENVVETPPEFNKIFVDNLEDILA